MVGTVAMSAEEFIASAECGKTAIACHDQILRVAFIYTDKALWEDDDGVFSVVDKMYARGWSFGQGDLRFNRTLDVFYVTQIAAGTYRSCEQFQNDDSEQFRVDEFDKFYDDHRELLSQDAWKQYYTTDLISQPISARFFRLPNLRDLPDSSDPLSQPRPHKGIGHFNKLPRWAHNAARTHVRQPLLSTESITQIALSTVQETIPRQRRGHSDVQAYSETQARFWLNKMNLYKPRNKSSVAIANWNPNDFGIYLGQGSWDVWAWEAHYSKQLWESSIGGSQREPDLDGTRESEVTWCGLPDGGTGAFSWLRGWEPEVGSEEEIAFLAAVAVEETKGADMDKLDYSMRSHILLALLQAAFLTEVERDRHVATLKQRIVEGGRIEEDDKAGEWIMNALLVMEPYARKHSECKRIEGQRKLLRVILEENGQLFARWKWPSKSKEFNFRLGPRVNA